jgi:hypothetical protein
MVKLFNRGNIKHLRNERILKQILPDDQVNSQQFVFYSCPVIICYQVIQDSMLRHIVRNACCRTYAENLKKSYCMRSSCALAELVHCNMSESRGRTFVFCQFLNTK